MVGERRKNGTSYFSLARIWKGVSPPRERRSGPGNRARRREGTRYRRIPRLLAAHGRISLKIYITPVKLVSVGISFCIYMILRYARTCRGTDAAAGGRIIPRKVLTSVQKRGKGFRSRDSGLRILSPFLRIFCGSGHVSIIESLASTGTDEFQLVAGWPMSRGPRMGFPGFCTSSFHGATRSFAFRPYLSFSPLSLSLPLPHFTLSRSYATFPVSLLFLRPLSDRFSFLVEPAELPLPPPPSRLPSLPPLLHLEGVVFYAIAGRLD